MIFVGALCFIIPALIWGLYLLAFRMRSIETVGTIVNYVGNSETQAPVVEFQLPDSTKVTFTGIYSSQNILEELFDAFLQHGLKKDPSQVRVLYDPNNPQKARINSFSNMYFVPVLLFVIGFCIILYAIPFFHDILAPIFNFIDRVSKFL